MSQFNQKLFRKGLARKRKVPRAGSVGASLAAQREYFKDIKKVIVGLAEIYRTRLLQELPELQTKVVEDLPLVRTDAAHDDTFKILDGIRITLSQRYSKEELRKIIERNGRSAANFNRKATEKQFERVAGVDLFLGNQELGATMSLFTENNVALIKSLVDDSVKKVEDVVFNSFRTGRRWEETVKEIEDYINPERGTVLSRAKFIARDQMAKLNGQLTEARQRSLGIKGYIWRGTLDGRERDSHREKEGNYYAWNDPPADTGHPGEDYQCRCTAEPYLGDILPGIQDQEE